jgi:prepilin-type N-terminal cleavage/methylation domain-containing protein
MKNTEESEGKKNRDRGFTLVEILVAIVILTIGLLAVGSMQISAIRGNFMGGNTSIALSLASEKMEDLLTSDFNDPPGVQKLTDRNGSNNTNLVSLSSTTNIDWDEYVSEEGVVGPGGFYRRIWNIANVPAVSPSTKNVVVIVTWENNKHRVSIATVKNQVVY